MNMFISLYLMQYKYVQEHFKKSLPPLHTPNISVSVDEPFSIRFMLHLKWMTYINFKTFEEYTFKRVKMCRQTYRQTEYINSCQLCCKVLIKSKTNMCYKVRSFFMSIIILNIFESLISETTWVFFKQYIFEIFQTFSHRLSYITLSSWQKFGFEKFRLAQKLENFIYISWKLYIYVKRATTLYAR